jgi:hypothetical protein
MFTVNTEINKQVAIKLILSAIIGISFEAATRAHMEDILLEEHEKTEENLANIEKATKLDSEIERVGGFDSDSQDEFIRLHFHFIDLNLSLG